MFLKNSIFLDFSLDQKYIFIIDKNKFYRKKILSLKRSENLPNIFYSFVKKNEIKINNTFRLYVNVGPGHIIAIRNSIVFAKILSLIFNCSLHGFSNYQLLKFFKTKTNKVLLIMRQRKLLLDLSKRKIKKLTESEVIKFKKLIFKIKYDKKVLENLVLTKEFEKKVFPISYSDI
ncbi:MAG: hypothetical protein CMI73_03560 [Candidatus Pelagibacter sp.]|nr:hypothetical protein [Candidatus Pelagibacter sp.]OUV86918.1 MAG: hypothetical protein CBC96_03490 [Pelagibacteraceae bacterium TMED136]|tara:strand:+ start:106 stop:630 length:525 start_codon:yes stop_codon:yes gene_type:complete